MARFFVACQLGHEEFLASEISEFWCELIDLDGFPTRSLPPEFKFEQGGVEFEAPEHLGFQINFFSKIANRVLMRICSFEARYFDQFEKSIKSLPLKDWIGESCGINGVNLKIESVKSRLNNEKSLLESWLKVLEILKIKYNKDSDLTVYMRSFKDRFVVSLDTSGEHLHKRGYAINKGEAPIRETLAALLVRKLFHYAKNSENVVVVDPFVGSGTLIFEAILRNEPNFARSYSWLKFEKCPKLFKSETWKSNYRLKEILTPESLIGYELNEKTFQAAHKNLESIKSVFSGVKEQINLVQSDCQNLVTRQEFNGAEAWLVANPPYGIRLNDNNAENLILSFEDKFDGMVFLHPKAWKLSFKSLKLVDRIEFSNQGLQLFLSVYAK